jgi:hypothetical protein
MPNRPALCQGTTSIACPERSRRVPQMQQKTSGFSPWGMYFHTRRGAPSTPRLCFCGLGGTEPPIVATSRHQYGGSRGFQPPHKANKSTSGFSPGGMACGSISPLARFVRHFLERLAYCRNLAGPCRRLDFRAANPPGPAHSRTLRRFSGAIPTLAHNR